MKHHIVGILFLSVGLLGVFAVPAFAQTTRANLKTTTTTQVEGSDSKEAVLRKANLEGRKEGTTPRELLCPSLTAKVNSKIGFLNQRKENHLGQFESIVERISTLMRQLKARGYDTSKVEADLVELQRLIAAAQQDYATFSRKLEAIKDLNCEDRDTYTAAMRDAQTSLEAFKKQVEAIRTFIQGTLKTDLKALKSERNTQEPSNSQRSL